MFRNVTLRLVLIYFHVTFLSIDNTAVNAIAWPECGEFVFPKDDINLTAEEKQFRRKLPNLFDSYDSGNTTGIESTLKSLEKFNVPFASERKKLAKQTLSSTLDIVSKVFFLIGNRFQSSRQSSKNFVDSVFFWFFYRLIELRMMDILPKFTK